MKSRSSFLFLILVLTVICYSNVISGELQFDDDGFINEMNPLLKDPFHYIHGNVVKLLFSGGRSVTNFTFALNYSLGGLSVHGYHITNMVIHLLVTLMLYVFIRSLFRVESVARSFNARGEWLALFIAGIFAIHPLQTESVSYIIQRSEMLSSLFYLAILYCLLRSLQLKGARSFVMWSMGLVCFVLGWGAKEVIVTSPVVFILYVLFFHERKYLRKAFICSLPFIVIGATIGIIFISRLKGNIHAGFDIRGIGQPEYLFTELRVLLTYIRLIFIPINQNLDYDYPIYRNLFEWPVLLSFMFLFLLSGFALFILYKSQILNPKSPIPNPQSKIPSPHLRMISFGILWFLIILMPTSSFVPLRDVIYEHRAYLAMVGVLLAAMAGIDLLCTRYGIYEIRNSKKILSLLCVTVLMVLSVLTYQRNMVWQTKFSLWQDVVKKSPNKSRPHNNLGNCYFLKNDYPSALRHYETALRIDPENVEAYYNVGLSLEKLGRRSDAVYYYLSFLEKADRSYKNQKREVRNKLGMR